MGDDRPPVYWEDDDLIIRASALGHKCMWELTAAGQGYPLGTLPSSLIKAFAEGNELEPVVINMLDAMGFTFLSHQEETNWEIEPSLIIRYHPDGIAEWRDNSWVVEVKALGDALWTVFVSRGMEHVIDEYPWQLSVMMEHTQLPGVWAGYNKDSGMLHLQPVMTSPIPREQLISKAKLIKEAVLGDDIMESGKPCDHPTAWPCRFMHLRPEVDEIGNEDNRILTVTSEDMEKVNGMVRQYIYSKGQADEATDTANRNRDSILEIGEGYDQIITDTWVVPIHGKDATTSYIDYDAMIADGIDVEKYRKTKPKSRYINKRNIKRRTDVEGSG